MRACVKLWSVVVTIGVALARGFTTLWAALALAVGLGAIPAAAGPFAYVTHHSFNIVTVIDTATNTVVATIPDPSGPLGAAFTPDGKHLYIADNFSDNVSVIDTAMNKVVATIPVGSKPRGVAVTPDGRHAYVTNTGSGDVSIIDTATNTVGITIPLEGLNVFPYEVAFTPDGKHAYVTVRTVCCDQEGSGGVLVIDTATNTIVCDDLNCEIQTGESPFGVAVTPDGKQVYVANVLSDNVSVIDTAMNKVVATIPDSSRPFFFAFTPDGKHAYVTNNGSFDVSVIDTATNTVVTRAPAGCAPAGVAFTPDGKHVYVTNNCSSNVSVIDTATNTMVATIPVAPDPGAVAIARPPSSVPFLTFSAKLEIPSGHSPNGDSFNLNASFVLGSASNGINAPTEPVTLTVGNFTTTIPPGSFTGTGFGPFHFNGVINGVRLVVGIEPTGAKRYAFHTKAHSANLTGTVNPVSVTLIVGNDSGTTPVKAKIH